jgi:hypothetical protein
MFNKKDFDHINKMNTEMADGMVDASESHEMLEKVIGVLSNTDYLSDDSRMELIMNIVNLCYFQDEDGEESLDEQDTFHVILGLCFAYSNIMTNMVMDGFEIQDYFDFLKSQVLPEMKEEAKSLPYWDSEDEDNENEE